jgi:hypothetical protein
MLLRRLGDAPAGGAERDLVPQDRDAPASARKSYAPLDAGTGARGEAKGVLSPLFSAASHWQHEA